jgi:hypothetical protein
VVESKVKGPKRLGQGVRGIGIGKKKHHQTVDSDDVEEQLGKDVLRKKYYLICCLFQRLSRMNQVHQSMYNR